MKPASRVSVALLGLSLVATMATTAAQAPETLARCLAEAADQSPVYATQTFPSTTKELVAVFRVPKGKYQKLTVKWVALDPGKPSGGGDVGLPGSADRGFAALPALQVGKYRLEVAADGKPWKSLDFTVAPEAAAVAIDQPENLLPIATGKVWTYTFAQEGGEGGTGWKKPLGTTFTFTAGSADKAGWAIDVRADNRSIGQVWWRVNESGFAVTQSLGEYKELTVFEPPAVLLPWPLTAPQTWAMGAGLRGAHRRADGELHQDDRAPLPAGDRPGSRSDHHGDQCARDAEQNGVARPLTSAGTIRSPSRRS